MPKRCLVCRQHIASDNDETWPERAYSENTWGAHVDYIHHACRPPAPAPAPRAAPPPPLEAVPAAPGDTHSAPSDFLDQYLTLPDAAKLLGVSTATLRRRIKARTLAAYRLAGGQTILVQRAALLNLLEPL